MEDFELPENNQKKKTTKELPTISLNEIDEANYVPLGDLGYDLATGGGTPLEVLMEIYGPNSAGKTTLCFEQAKSFLKRFPDKEATYYNYERSIDKFYVRDLFENDESLIRRFKIIQPSFFEDGAEDLLLRMEKRTNCFIIVDSLAAMTPSLEDEKDLSKAQVGGFKGKLMAEFCRKMGSRLPGSGLTIAFINHENVLLNTGPMAFIKQTSTPGGDSLKFWASLRFKIQPLNKLTKSEFVIAVGKSEEVPFGNVIQVQIVKNKFHPPFKKAIMYVIYGKGIERTRTLIDFCLALGLILRKGKTDYYVAGRESNTVKGIQNLSDRLKENQPLYSWLEKEVSKALAAASPKNENLESFETELKDI